MFIGEAWVRIHHQREKLTDEIQSQLKKAIFVDKSQKNRVLIDKRLYLSDKSTLIEEKYWSVYMVRVVYTTKKKFGIHC